MAQCQSAAHLHVTVPKAVQVLNGHLVLQNVQSIHEAILAVRSEISILHARTERTASILNELIRRFASALEMG